ncbi:DNA-binding protein [Corynebacterium suranareeae]|uniref:DNA-binding protein n=1 Tax=Corynebacterium suranareeae TaxID=2506452 RepID=A0A160PMV7_9CORY|nr:helicase-associated domain-containing protein [Corynebacterium suranareeae]BAU95197.1 DNA-binding protein [Corynebacterium suranareeae]
MKKDSPVPTLKGWLDTQSDDQLSVILRNRPDAVLPLPPNLGSLAARLQLRASAVRAVLKLNALELAVLEAAANIGGELHPVSAPEVVEYLRATLKDDAPSEAQIDAAIITLKNYALLFGDEQVMIAQETMAALPAFWRLLPEVGDRGQSEKEVRESVEKLSERHRKLLDTLAASGGFGLTRDAGPNADPTRPVPQLLAAGLLARVDEQTVRLPAMVRHIIEGREQLPAQVKEVTPSAVPGSDDAGLAAGLEVVRHMRLLIDALSLVPAPTLKSSGVGVRVVSRLKKELGFDDTELFRLVCLGTDARLLRIGVPDPLPADDNGGDYLAPTELADEWLDADLNQQLATLMTGWWEQTWAAWLVGEADEKDKPIHLLSYSNNIDGLEDTRAKIMASLTRVTPEDLHADLAFHYPLAASRMKPETITHLIEEAKWIGAYADGVTAPGRALVEGAQPEDVISAPTPVETFHVQGDFTIMVPGPLTPTMQKMMDSIATLESPGLASVYRLSEKSIRHALDVGLTTPEILEFLKDHSMTELPQSVGYLLSDIARKHGTLRGGPALCYIRSDDPALLHSAVEAGADVALRQIAPTVAIAQAPLLKVITLLRNAGFQPVAEDGEGASLNIAPSPARVPVYIPGPPVPALDEGRIAAAVKAIRRENSASKGTVSTQPTLAVLQAAVRGQKTVTLGFVDKQGVAVHRIVKPLTVNAGQVDAVDEATGAVHRFMLHRITEVIVDN